MAVSLVSTGVTFPDSSTQITAATGFGFKNRILNGQMVIDQRNAGALITNPTNQQFLVDRWQYEATQTSKVNIRQNYNSVTPPVGFTNYLGVVSNSAYSIVASDIFDIRQVIEGFNVSDLAWGTSDAKTVTLSFQVYSSLTGTFGGVLKNSAQDRSYPFTYTISSANTWTTISVTIAGDTSGTWLKDNGVGIRIVFGLGVGSTYSGTAGAWAGASYYSATGATSVVGTNGATFYITGVQLEKGSTATSFDYRPYGTELALCQRYFNKSYNTNTAVGTASTTAGIIAGKVSSNTVPISESYCSVSFPVSMRIAPTVTIYGFLGGSGVVSSWSGVDQAANTGNINNFGTSGFVPNNGSGGTFSTTVNAVLFHYAATAEL
jgi:hypothetical protein